MQAAGRRRPGLVETSLQRILAYRNRRTSEGGSTPPTMPTLPPIASDHVYGKAARRLFCPDNCYSGGSGPVLAGYSCSSLWYRGQGAEWAVRKEWERPSQQPCAPQLGGGLQRKRDIVPTVPGLRPSGPAVVTSQFQGLKVEPVGGVVNRPPQGGHGRQRPGLSGGATMIPDEFHPVAADT